MTYLELKDDPEIKWTKEPIVGLTMTMAGNDGLTDSMGMPIMERRKYWVGKHTSGMLVILPAEDHNKVLNDDLMRNSRLN